MTIYDCPCCSERSVMWDSRSRVFLCFNPQCAAAFEPPQLSGLNRSEVIEDLSLNRLNVTQVWLEQAMSEQCRAEGIH